MLAYAILTALKLETGIRPFMETRHLGTIHVLPHYCYVIFDTLPLCRQTSTTVWKSLIETLIVL